MIAAIRLGTRVQVPGVLKITALKIGIPLPAVNAPSLAMVAVSIRRPNPMRWRINNASFADPLAATFSAHAGSRPVRGPIRQDAGEAPVVRDWAEVSESGRQDHLCLVRSKSVGRPWYQEVDLGSWTWDGMAGQADPDRRLHSPPSGP